MLVRLGKLHDGEEKSKEGDIDIGVHDDLVLSTAEVTCGLHCGVVEDSGPNIY